MSLFNRLVLLLIVFCSGRILCSGFEEPIESPTIEFLYPVAAHAQSPYVYVIHQKTPDMLRLFLWDPRTGKALPALSSLYIPAGLTPLADGTGFSFIEYGRIRVKKLTKRSPRTIDFSQMIYDISQVRWIDGFNGYCCAKKRDRFGIFHITMRGDCYRIAGSLTYDCLYPQKIDTSLFYIERSEAEDGYHYDIVQQPYPNTYRANTADNTLEAIAQRMEKCFQEPDPASVCSDNSSLNTGIALIRCGRRPLIYLTMHSLQEGFVLEHNPVIDPQATSIAFTYHLLKKYDGVWTLQPLFAFSIPANLLKATSGSRLYESLLPLLPQRYEKEIYFVDCDKTKNLSLYAYRIGSGEIVQQVKAPDNVYYFPPALSARQSDLFFYGGSLTDQGGPFLDLSKQASLSLPLFRLK